MNTCDDCEYFKDVWGNFVQCIKTGRFIDYEYWRNEQPKDCPMQGKSETGVDDES